ncbi:lytic transglycosylase domain-containing protein [Pontibacter akesuensis]|uniref:Transglycosylase SLT domain-containing protein n=1 Tax=Pontibacter akesuensis TaxID=388950 RepID=A0A1I7KTQ7_9BACT|nr:lytic transglycosylase domain-containing protein [Pontibacter akesuensis]GHA80641.1 murein transglycosylase [Pontibacter akesuensis]SFV00841.1 Transglycosylase SLT domain-containing protein [Pontibacter akesuensis]
MAQQIWRYVWGTMVVVLALQFCSQQPHVAPTTETTAETNKAGFTSPPLPEALTFAGEVVPLEIPDVAERLDRELLSNSYYHSGTLLGLKRMQRYVPEIKRLLRENDVPEDFIYLALAESLFGQVTSPAGASGFWQLMPDTARGYGMIVNSEVDERFHVEKATIAACRYLKSAKKRFGTWTNAAASYNRGMGGLDRALEKQGVSSYYDLYLNDETSRYMFRILALKEVLGNPAKYGFHFTPEQGYNPLPTRSVTVTSTISNLPKYALEQGTNYKTLRLYNPWIKDYELTVPSGKQFVLELPAK